MKVRLKALFIIAGSIDVMLCLLKLTGIIWISWLIILLPLFALLLSVAIIVVLAIDYKLKTIITAKNILKEAKRRAKAKGTYNE